jgi:hypothetical protein
MLELARKIIDDPELRDGIFIEMGSGPGIQNALAAVPGSSKVLETGLYPNSKEAQQRLGLPAGVRSVSREGVSAILAGQPKDRTVVVSSWQIPSSEPVDTHGWVGVRHQGATGLYHLSLTDVVGQDRAKAQNLISELGLELLSVKGVPVVFPRLLHVDQAFDANLKSQVPLVLSQFANLPEDLEHLIYIDENGDCQRPTDRLRKANKDGVFPVFKGSFNPPTVAHRAMADFIADRERMRPTFMISVNTRFKGAVDLQNLQNRIGWITALGYSVMVCCRGGFVENTQMFRDKGLEVPVDFLCGSDTRDRLATEDFIGLERLNAKLLVVDRPSLSRGGSAATVTEDLSLSPMAVSSTDIRMRVLGSEELIPEEIRERVLATLR